MLSRIDNPVCGRLWCENGRPAIKKQMLMSDTNPSTYEHIVFTEFDGSEGILVDLNTKKYYQINETAMLIWKGLEKGLPANEIAAEMTATYEITTEAALQSVEQALKSFQTYKLVRSS
jgi:hypothetical protein